jgi:hypothetical protein
MRGADAPGLLLRALTSPLRVRQFALP